MKKYVQLVLLSALLFIGACKKSEQPTLSNDAGSGKLTTNASVPPLSVITIAGQYNTDGFVDGTGSQARFHYPYGIDIGEDGNLYVADLFNDAIRKVTPDGVVTTISIPAAADGQRLRYPEKVLFSKDGSINILTSIAVSPESLHRLWILKPNGELLTPAAQVNYYTYVYYSLSKDPFSDYLQICGDRYVTGRSGLRQGFIESAEIVNGVAGRHPYTPPLDSLNTPSREASAITRMYCGNNGVKYLVTRGKYIYKLTKSGVFTQIFRDINFREITDLVATKDSRTLYMVSGGEIVSVSNNKLTKLVGLNGKFSSPDGVGKNAYVFANYLALSKDESTIYFSDNETIRKLILR
ncbi:hypothetical protein IM792_05805 [Mucilaginibacter sp. JRF]|uniref:hypothetical protein n=1 Tax=Mucilaginibacter sp. JRF TaxID=2780088 RepID=UPI00187FFA4E|nr:hypothetical protein [Mucilaginibacter sp. JRF]MBE9583956.1 hypothetical protein [Mucilaginibacter sp. JRF]